MINEDDFEDGSNALYRSNSWPNRKGPSFNAQDSYAEEKPSYTPNYLTSISETDPAHNQTSHVNEFDFEDGGFRSGRSNSLSSAAPYIAPSPLREKKRRQSYTELIASAILSSPEKKRTLAEIYDWFVQNVPSFKDQRYMHSSLGWKNAVRHNLSVQTCFKRVKRHGMEKPSWWTVDIKEISKRRLFLQPSLLYADNEECPARKDSVGSNASSAGSPMEDRAADEHRESSNEDVTMGQPLNSTVNLIPASAKRTAYTPIRPAVTVATPTIIPAAYVQQSYGTRTDCMNGTASHMTNIHTTYDRPAAPLKTSAQYFPCSVQKYTHAARMDPVTTTDSKVAPVVTLVYAHESGTGQKRVELEVSCKKANGCEKTDAARITAAFESLLADKRSGGLELGDLVSNHFQALAGTNQCQTNCDSRTGVAGTQVLWVKTTGGSVQDVRLTGVLPMRTVVKRDEFTQTEQRTKDANNAQWVKAENGNAGVNFSCAYANLNNCRNGDNFANNGFQFANHSQSFSLDLPADLANLQIEGDLQCDIANVLHAGVEAEASGMDLDDNDTYITRSHADDSQNRTVNPNELDGDETGHISMVKWFISQ